MCLGLELELGRLLGDLRQDVGLDVELRLSFYRCLSRRSFSIFPIRPSSSARSLGSRWGFQVYRPIRPKAWIRDGSWLTFE
jgi:hypothetical protein